jgi:predicted outer membrane repeat protein
LTALCCAAVPAPGTTYYVDADAPGRSDGSTWEHAFTDLQGALAVAQNGDRILVAQGTYRPTGPDGDRTIAFALVSGVGIYGGYAGYGGPDPDARDPVVYETVLSGDLNADDRASFENTEENSYHVLTARNCTEATTLDGVTITAGHANGPQWTNDHAGGGFLCVASGAKVHACRLSRNQATYGAGACSLSGAVRFIECAFHGNASVSGGGGHLDLGGSPEFSGCVLDGNTASNGAGAAVSGGGEASLTDCVFAGNIGMAEFGGGLVITEMTADVSGCVFANNTAPMFGGGIYTNSITLPVRLRYCLFAENHAGLGGAINSGDRMNVLRCSFVRNEAISGGAIMGSMPVRSCLFRDNQAEARGGAIWSYGTIKAQDSTFVGNVAGEEGGGVYLNQDGSSTLIVSDVLWANEPDQIHVGNPSGRGAYRYCLIQGGFPGEGNFDADPRFVDPDGGDYRLAVDSPAIDAGDPEFQQEPGERDLDGRPRVLCDRVDIGAYEFGSGDYDCDRRIDLDDYENWTACFTGPDAGPYPAGCEAFDFDFDADVDLADFAALMTVFAGE